MTTGRVITLVVGALLLLTGHPAGALLIVVVLVWGYTRSPGGKASAGCAFAGAMFSGGVASGNHTSAFIAKHEAGHVAVARRIGRRVTDVKVGKGWGWVGIAGWHKDPIKNMAFLYGGQIAVGSTSGCSFDNAKIEYFLNKIPPEDRAAATRKAKSIARSATGMLSSVPSDAKKIRETGKV